MSTLEFNTLFNTLTQTLMNFSFNLTKDRVDAEDLYQETAIRVYRNMDKFKSGTNFKAWCFTIMKNIFINNYRKKQKRNTIFDATDNMHYINTGGKAINNSAEGNIMMDELNGMLKDLDDSIKVPFEMYFTGFKYQEIAEKLDLPLGTVKSRIFFARREMKKKVLNRYDTVPL